MVIITSKSVFRRTAELRRGCNAHGLHKVLIKLMIGAPLSHIQRSTKKRIKKRKIKKKIEKRLATNSLNNDNSLAQRLCASLIDKAAWLGECVDMTCTLGLSPTTVDRTNIDFRNNHKPLWVARSTAQGYLYLTCVSILEHTHVCCSMTRQ